MSDKSDAIAGLEAARKETLDSINGIPEEKMAIAAFGSWSVKDVLCHLASWEQFAVPDLQRISRGHIPQLATLRLEEIDDWNVVKKLSVTEKTIHGYFMAIDYDNISPVPDSIIGIRDLLDDGHEVEILSSNKRKDAIRHWLDTHGLRMVPLEAGIHDKPDFARENGFDILVEEALRYKEQGFTAFKTGVPKKRPARIVETPAFVQYAAEKFAELREAVGPECDIGIDFHGAISPQTAMLLIKALEKYQPMFIEEPVQCQNVDVMA
ncbi:hypothetical protein LCGC14_2960690, partial [marine sediment metagenome]